jgi:hypothetical protein
MKYESCVLCKHVFGVVVSGRVSQNGISGDAHPLLILVHTLNALQLCQNC